MEWQDLRILLAIARTGSVVAAGRELAVAHTTVSRRLAALELDRSALFGAPRYFERRGEPARPIDDLSGHEVIAYSGNFPWQPGEALLEAAGARVRSVMTTNHPHGAIEAVAAGIGLAVVPCFLGHA